VEILPEGSYGCVLVTPKAKAAARQELLQAARAGEELDPARARHVRVIEYEIPDRDGQDELIALVTTITDPLEAPAAVLAAAYHQRWEHETANAQLKTFLRGPGRVLRSQSPDMIEQEIWGYLLAHHAISALICTAATSAGIDPDRVKLKRTIRAARSWRAAARLAPPAPAALLPAAPRPTTPPPRELEAARAATPPRALNPPPPQLLPRQETRRPRTAPQRTAHDHARQPRKTPG